MFFIMFMLMVFFVRRRNFVWVFIWIGWLIALLCKAVFRLLACWLFQKLNLSHIFSKHYHVIFISLFSYILEFVKLPNPFAYYLRTNVSLYLLKYNMSHEILKTLIPFYHEKYFLIKNKCKTPIGCLVFIFYQKIFF